MTSQRIQRRIERMLDQAEEAVEARDWALVQELSRNVVGPQYSIGP